MLAVMLTGTGSQSSSWQPQSWIQAREGNEYRVELLARAGVHLLLSGVAW